ncbi:NAD-dependent epimerase/dehydratase family protein [Candidatus Margulisiibacteriota bacterium]
MKLFITGATGGLGKKLIPKLNSETYDLTLLSIDQADPFKQKNAKIITADLLAPEKYQEYLTDIDTLIHFAAVTHTNDEKLYYRINTEGTRLLVKAAQKAKVGRFIFISTRAIGEKGGAYSNSKRLAEEIVKNSGLLWTIVRPAEVYGVTEGEAITKLIKNIKKMPIIPIIGKGNYKIAPVYIDDVINALLKIIKNNDLVGKIYTLAGPNEFSYLEFVNKVLEIKKTRKIKVKIPLHLLRLIAFMCALLRIKNPPLVKDQLPRLIIEKSADISLAKQDLDYEPAAIDQFISG